MQNVFFLIFDENIQIMLFLKIFSSEIGGVMVSMLASSALSCWFKLQLGQIKDHKIVRAKTGHI
jgi:hypothetical protein